MKGGLCIALLVLVFAAGAYSGGRGDVQEIVSGTSTTPATPSSTGASQTVSPATGGTVAGSTPPESAPPTAAPQGSSQIQPAQPTQPTQPTQPATQPATQAQPQPTTATSTLPASTEPATTRPSSTQPPTTQAPPSTTDTTRVISAGEWASPALPYHSELVNLFDSIRAAASQLDLPTVQEQSGELVDAAHNLRLALVSAGPPPPSISVEGPAVIAAAAELERKGGAVVSCVGPDDCPGALEGLNAAAIAYLSAAQRLANKA